MDEISLRNWMKQQKINAKVISDTVSRLKRIEKEFNYCDLDDEFQKNQCKKCEIRVLL